MLPATVPGAARAVAVAVSVAVVLGLGAAGCGADEEPAATPEARGVELGKVHGCASCHGAAGEGGFGPPWQGLAGSDVELADGRTVVADDEYLRRAIVEPHADIRAGYSVPMPENGLAPAEVDDLIAHIKSFD